MNMSKKVQAAQIIEALGERLPFVKTAKFTWQSDPVTDSRDVRVDWSSLMAEINVINKIAANAIGPELIAQIGKIGVDLDSLLASVSTVSLNASSQLAKIDLIKPMQERILGIERILSRLRSSEKENAELVNRASRASAKVRDIISGLGDVKAGIVEQVSDSTELEGAEPLASTVVAPTAKTPAPTSAIPDAQTELLAEYQKVDEEIKESFEALDEKPGVSDETKAALIKDQVSLDVALRFFMFLEMLSDPNKPAGEKRLARAKEHLYKMPSFITMLDNAIKNLEGP